MRTAFVIAASLVFISCGGDSGTGGDPDGGGTPGGDGAPVQCLGLESLALDPESSTATLDGGAAAPITFVASGTLAVGGTITVDPTLLAWSASRADDTPPGTIDDGVLMPFPYAGGTVTITATDGCVAATAVVVFYLDAVVGDPVDPGAWTGTPVTGGTAPLVVYPSDETRFPRNIWRTLFQWRTGGHTQFRLVFDGPSSRVVIYTDGAHASCATAAPPAGCWEADEGAWSFIAGSNAGETVTWVVDALDTTTTPPTVRRSETIDLGFSRRDVAGAIFYWSTTSAGIRRANIADAVPEDYLTGKPGTVYSDPPDEVGCVACHVVSRDGRYLAAPVSADSGKSLWILEVTATAPPNPIVKSIANTGGHGFATISPDNEHVVAAWRGAMWMLDRATGNHVADLDLGLFDGTHPDWSPDDTQLVFATGSGDGPGGASLAVLPYLGGTAWGPPEVIVPAEGDRTNLFPMFSHDGQWIAFSRGKGGHGDREAQLFVVPGAGGTAVELINANRVVSNQLGDGQTENNQPTWGPPGDYDWIAFNSKREYGVVLGEGTQQIWVSAIDVDAAISGEDPSFPAFRLQFQGLEENNHRAYWTQDIRDPLPDPPDAGPPDPDAGPCVPAMEMCDPVLQNCCDPGVHCETQDDGLTYTCIPIG